MKTLNKLFILLSVFTVVVQATQLKTYQNGKVVQLSDYKTGKYLTNKSSLMLDNTKVELYSIINNESPYWRTSSYRYEVTADGKQLYKGGLNNTHTKLDNEPFIEEKVSEPGFVHELFIDGKKVGWLYGWNKHADYDENLPGNRWHGYGYSTTYEIDFSVARLIVPMLDEDNKITIFTRYLTGIKFTDIGKYLEEADNELKIISTKDNCNYTSAFAGSYYYVPQEWSIKVVNGKVTVTNNKLEFPQKYIDTNPFYVFGVAQCNENFELMKKVYEQVKDEWDDSYCTSRVKEDFRDECEVYNPYWSTRGRTTMFYPSKKLMEKYLYQ